LGLKTFRDKVIKNWGGTSKKRRFVNRRKKRTDRGVEAGGGFINRGLVWQGGDANESARGRKKKLKALGEMRELSHPNFLELRMGTTGRGDIRRFHEEIPLRKNYPEGSDTGGDLFNAPWGGKGEEITSS